MDKQDLTAHYAQAGIPLRLEKLYELTAGPVWGAWIAGGKPAIALWEALRKLNRETGYWPVFTGEQLACWRDWPTGQAAEWLAAARHIDVESWFAARQESGPLEEDGAWADLAEDMGLSASLANSRDLTDCFTPFDLLTGRPLERLGLALVPTREPAEVAALIGFGGWNACPTPPEQVAIQAYWFSRYGAEPVALTRDVLEMRVARPPEDAAAAEVLARQQYAFCDDIVLQGMMSLANLKNLLIDNPNWYFWWD